MGSPGRTPILQVGGVQDAKTVAPRRLARAVALLFPEVLVVRVKAATSGLVVLQVRGGLGTVTPKVSSAVAVIDTLPPLFTVIEFPAWLWPPIWRWMAWLRQLVNGKGLLVVPETLAARLEMPGALPMVLASLRTLGSFVVTTALA